MNQFWRKRFKNRWAVARYWPRAEGLFWRYNRQGLFDPIQALHERFAANIPHNYPGAKYLHRYDYYLKENIARGIMLSLPRAKLLRILDIGSGPGYFCHLCRHWGHDVVGLDVAGNQIFDKLTDVLAYDRLEMAIEAQAPIALSGPRFDLITASSIDFDEIGRVGQLWQATDWHALLDDLSRHLQPNGRLFLRLNLDKYAVQHVKEIPALYTVLKSHPKFNIEKENHRDLLLRAP